MLTGRKLIPRYIIQSALPYVLLALALLTAILFTQQTGRFAEIALYTDLVFRCRGCSHGAGSALSKRLQTQLRATQRLAPFVFAQESRLLPESIHKEMAELTHRLIGRVLERQPRLRSTFNVPTA